MRLHPLSAVRNGLRRAVLGFSTVFFLASMLNVAAGVDIGWLFVLAPLGALLGAGYGVADYWLFEYELTGDTLDVRSGVLARQEREIPLGRVQNVDVQRTLVQRLLGVAVVRVETAGGSDTEAVLDLVGREEADRLQRDIRERAGRRSDTATDTDAAADTDAAPGSDAPASRSTGASEGGVTGTAEEESAPGAGPTPLFSLSTGELLVFSLTSFRPGGIVVVFALASFGWPLVSGPLVALLDRLGGPTVLSPSALTAGGLVVLLVVALPLALVSTWVVSAAVSFVRYYGFRLGRHGDDLVYERGLFQRYSGSIPLGKVQALTVTEPLFARWLGYAGLRVETAGYAPGRESGPQATAAVPIAPRERVLDLASGVESFDSARVERPPRRARRRYAVRYLLGAGVLLTVWYVLAGVAGVGDPALRLLPVVLLPVAPVAAHLTWRHRGHRLGEECVVLRSGLWVRDTHLVPYYRLQTVSTEHTVFQRRANLASVVADTASSATLRARDPTAHDVDVETARTLHWTLRERLGERVGSAPFR